MGKKKKMDEGKGGCEGGTGRDEEKGVGEEREEREPENVEGRRED